VSVRGGTLDFTFGSLNPRPKGDRGFKRELDAELVRMKAFLGLPLQFSNNRPK
jgi:hypothetical protein